jgi:hypothetical protein
MSNSVNLATPQGGTHVVPDQGCTASLNGAPTGAGTIAPDGQSGAMVQTHHAVATSGDVMSAFTEAAAREVPCPSSVLLLPR